MPEHTASNSTIIDTHTSNPGPIEHISHNSANFRIFLSSLDYLAPHSHLDFEIGLILNGTLQLNLQNQVQATDTLSAGDFFIINPYQGHEISAASPILILPLQVPASFFDSYYPAIHFLEFTECTIHASDYPELCKTICQNQVQIARSFYSSAPAGQLQCSALINDSFYQLLSTLPTHVLTDQERASSQLKGQRARRIAQYIDEHFTEKILLNDIAEMEGLDLFYLSHFFTEQFGMPFQTYLTKIRCEKARTRLLLTDESLLNISVALGFSDPKYFNKGFKTFYGYTPKEYRKQFSALNLSKQQRSTFSMVEHYSSETALSILDSLFPTK